MSFADTGRVELSQINVLIGRNNSGKSAFIRAILQLQRKSGPASQQDIRLRADNSELRFEFEGSNLFNDLQRYFRRESYRNSLDHGPLACVVKVATEGDNNELRASLAFRPGDVDRDYEWSELSHAPDVDDATAHFLLRPAHAIPPTEPDNFIYPYLSKRKVAKFDLVVDIVRTRAVYGDIRSLPAKVDRLAHPGYSRYEQYVELCEKVLGFRVGSYAAAGGKQVGIQVGDFDDISLEFMGEGVSSLLGLIVDLCMADGHLFLIEEPENDIHPEALKKLLDVIIQKSVDNQFIVSTHSNIVAKYLGAAEECRLFSVNFDYAPNTVPTSFIELIDNSTDARIGVLRQLGYELYDFDLWEGWLILEESSAQAIISHYLIRWFAPRLTRVRIIAAGGVTKVRPAFEDFHRLFLFAHLERVYVDRAWVIVDGDPSGKRVVEQLRSSYKSWAPEHFRAWQETDFERYYPERFASRVEEVLNLPHDEKREAKKRLLREVKNWADSAEDEAMAEFATSAAEVIDVLKEIDRTLFSS